MSLTNLAKQIKTRRMAECVSLTELSRHTGISEAHLSRLESGKRRDPRLSTLLKLKTALGFDSIEEMTRECRDELRDRNLISIKKMGIRRKVVY